MVVRCTPVFACLPFSREQPGVRVQLFAMWDTGFSDTDTGPLQPDQYQENVSNHHQSHVHGATQAGLNEQLRNDGLCSSPSPPGLGVFIPAYYFVKNTKEVLWWVDLGWTPGAHQAALSLPSSAGQWRG